MAERAREGGKELLEGPKLSSQLALGQARACSENSSFNLCGGPVNNAVICIFQARKGRCREVKNLAQGHTASSDRPGT